MTIKATAITSGQSSPATLAEDAGHTSGYRWRGIPGWQPGQGQEDRRPVVSAERSHQRRQERIAAFAAVLKEIAPHAKPGAYPLAALIEAGRRVGVGETTAKEYDRHLQQAERS